MAAYGVAAEPIVYLKRFRLGSLLELTARLYFRTFFRLVGGFILIFGVCALPIALLTYHEFVTLNAAFGHLGSGIPTVQAMQSASSSSLPIEFFLAELFYFAGTLVAAAYCFCVAADGMFGVANFGKALRRATGRLLSIIWVYFIFGLLFIFPPLIFYFFVRDTSSSVRLGAIGVMLIYWIWLEVSASLTLPCVLFDGAKGRAAIGRSMSLVKGAWFRCLGTYSVVFILGYVVAYIAALVVAGSLVVAATGAGSFGRFAVILAIASSLGIFALVPIGAVFSFLLYFNLSVKSGSRVEAGAFGREIRANVNARGLVYSLAGPMEIPPLGGMTIGPPPGISPGAPGGAPPAGWMPPGAQQGSQGEPEEVKSAVLPPFRKPPGA